MHALRWNDVEAESIGELVTRRVVWGENCNLTRFTITKGAHVAAHQHEAEQITWVVEGALRLRFDGGEEVVLRAGDMLVIAPQRRHEAWAEEDSTVLDFFAPRREDWRRGESGYLAGRARPT